MREKNPRRKPEKKHLYKQMPVTDGEELECAIWEELECDIWGKNGKCDIWGRMEEEKRRGFNRGEGERPNKEVSHIDSEGKK